MAVVESFIPVPTTPYKLDGVGVTTSEGLAVREMVTIGDPETTAARAAVTNSCAMSGDYGVVTRSRVTFEDCGNLDAFGRVRVSSPSYVFDGQFTYNLHPSLFEPITAETGASVAHDATNRCALMTFSSTPTGGKAYMQSFEHFRYQPGRSQLVYVTFNFRGGVANVLKFAGYSDGSNGVELQLNGTSPRIVIYSDTGHGDQIIAHADWYDKLDGSGPSGLTVDWATTQILAIDLQALYVGRVRLGLVINGAFFKIAEDDNANIQANPYIQTANLPVRVGMTCTGTASTTMEFICCSVISEGGQEDIAGFNHSIEGTGTAGNGAQAHILSVRPKTTFNSITNRVKFVLESIDIIVTGNSPVKWELVLGQAISGTTTFTDVNTARSAFEYNTAGTISGSPTLVIQTGYVASSATTKGVITTAAKMKYPITLDAAGAVRSLGTLSILATGIGAASACRASLNWREIR